MTSDLASLLAGTLSSSGLFAGLTPERITALEPRRGHLAEGTVLFRRGDPAPNAYLILDGILGLHTGEADRPEAYFRKVAPGELVGEYGPLCGEHRSATALALTPVDFLVLDRDQLRELLEGAPDVESRLITALAEAASIGRVPGRMGLETIVIHDASPGSPLTAAVRARLPELLVRLGGHPGALEIPAGAGAEGVEARLYRWLVEANRSRRPQVLFTRDPEAISHRNQLLIDRLLILCDGTAPVVSLPATADPRALLVRLWPEGQRPSSRDWTTATPCSQVLNVQPGRDLHLERLARAVLRRQTVLVLGGGGARGFAHVGALAALEELGLDAVDMVMGVSIGSLVASLVAFEQPAAAIFQHLERVIIRERPYSLTLPRQSLFSLRNSRRELERFFGPALVEDGWLPLRCFSANLSSKRLEAWTGGDVCTAVIASMSVPGIFPPVADERGNLHVDGGILNNLPVAEARRETDGRVLAVSLDQEPRQEGTTAAGREPRRAPPSIGRTIIDAMMCGSHFATRTQEHLADLVLRPEIAEFPFLDWKQYRRIYERGYQETMRQLRDGWPAPS